MARRSPSQRAHEHHERMSVVDTAWLRMDVPGNPAMIVSVLMTATPVPAAELRKVVVSRLLCFPRFRRRPVADPLGASWQDDPGFDLDAHFVPATLPAPAGRAELEEFVARLAGERLDPARPLWQIHFFEHYGAGSAWVLRVHHCYADGMAMLRVLLSLTGQDPTPALAAATPAAAVSQPAGRRAHAAGMSPRPSRLVAWLDQVARPASDILESALVEGARLFEGGVHRAFHPQDTAALALQAGGMVGELGRVLALPDDPPTPLRGALSGVKRVAWSSQPLDLVEVQSVGRALGCTVNDVLMATVAGALGSHLRGAHGWNTRDLVLRASVPVNLRAAEDATLGNRFGLAFVDLDVGTRDPLARLFRTHDTLRTLKGSLQPPMTLMVLGLLGLLPAPVQAPAIELFSRKATLVASNVPGPQAPLRLCGQRISEMYFWVPQSGSIGVGVSIFSYAGQVFLGLIADRNLVPDPRPLADGFVAEFERLALVASVAVLGARSGRRRGPTRKRGPAPPVARSPPASSRRKKTPAGSP